MLHNLQLNLRVAALLAAALVLGLSSPLAASYSASFRRMPFNVNGAQYIDERVATFTVASGQFAYYLGSNNFSVTGMGNADGSVIERLDYSSTGDFAGGGPGAGAFYHDADDDLDIDLRDFANFQVCFDPSGTQTTQACLDVHDFDTGGASDGDIDLDDYARWFECFRGPFVTPNQACGIPMRAGAPPPSGTFGMHGRAFDVLSDGFVLQDFRGRTYWPQLGRWFQRDALDYVDTRNLYEAFSTNPLSRLDPHGLDSVRRTNGFLEYTTDGFAWDFAKVLGNGLVLIDHPQWPFAFIMREQHALDAFKTTGQPDFYNVFSIMAHATGLATQSGSKTQIVALFDKRSTSLGWIEPGKVEIDTMIALRELGTAGLQAQLAGVGNLTATAFTVTTGALAVPAGAGAAAVDVVATGLDVAGGRVSLTGGAVAITAVAAGTVLHFSFADDLSRIGRPTSAASDLRFTQVTASPRFTKPKSLFYGESIGDVAQSLRSGTRRAADVPITYIERNGKRLIVNTRSALALRRAGIPSSKWRFINATGNTDIERSISRRLLDNGLTDEGTSTLRITGAKSRASFLE